MIARKGERDLRHTFFKDHDLEVAHLHFLDFCEQFPFR